MNRVSPRPLASAEFHLEESGDDDLCRFADICVTHAGPYIRALFFSNISPGNPHILSILRSTPNLEVLQIGWRDDQFSVPLDQFLPSSPPFQLQVFIVFHIIDITLHAFLQAQASSLLRLDILQPTDISTPNQKRLNMTMPFLRVITAHSRMIRQPLAASPSLRCMVLVDLRAPLRFVAQSVRALQISVVDDWPDDCGEAFPNLEFLQFVEPGSYNALYMFPQFKSLQKLRVIMPPSQIEVATPFDQSIFLRQLGIEDGRFGLRRGQIDSLFADLNSLQVAEVDIDGRWTIKRGSRRRETSEYIYEAVRHPEGDTWDDKEVFRYLDDDFRRAHGWWN